MRRRRPDWPSRPRRPCACSTAAGRTSPGCAKSRILLSRVAWQSPVWLHPDTARAKGVEPADILRVETRWGSLEAPAYVTEVVHPGLALMGIGQGHTSYGRTRAERGRQPLCRAPRRGRPCLRRAQLHRLRCPHRKNRPQRKTRPYGRQPHSARPHVHSDHDAGRPPEGTAPGQDRPHDGRFSAHAPAAGGLQPRAGFLPAPRPRPLPLGHGGGPRPLHRLRRLRCRLHGRKQHRHRRARS